MEGCFAEILPLSGIPNALIYRIDTPLNVGSLVRITIRNKVHFGLITKIYEDLPESNFKFLPILNCVYSHPILNADGIKVIQWLMRYYGCTTLAALETALPALVRKGKAFPINYCLRVTDLHPQFNARSKQQCAVYHWISEHPNVSLDIFKQTFPKQTQTLTTLINKQYVERFVGQNNCLEILGKPSAFVLTDEQQSVFQAIEKHLTSDQASTHLLWGITGSGKTEIYHALILEAKKLQKQTLYLVPEITLSEQALAKLKSRLQASGIRIAVWHSRLSDTEKLRTWQQALSGAVDVLLGTRSALFVPLPQLKLVIVDEEHEPSYKQSENPRYHGRDLAVYRAFVAQATCVLGSATPSVESWTNAHNGKYFFHSLKSRPSGQTLPKIHLADMRYEKPNFEGTFLLSNLLREKINERLDRQEQTLLFLNRRGYAPYLYCPNCEKRLECPHCRTNLVYHKKENCLRCHLCDYQEPFHATCKVCKTALKLSRGLGTQRIETCLQQLYKNARIIRLDTDVIQQHSDWYQAILEQRYDIIIGTQMLAKGLDFPKLTLVGMIQADAQTTPEDFRISERTFQLLVQVSGRAGRASRPGEVVIQSFNPEAASIRYGIQQDVQSFLDQEYQLRQRYAYPPFRHIIRHIFRSRSESTLYYVVQKWTQYLKKNQPEMLEILGPVAPSINKINGFYRMHLLLFTPSILQTLPILKQLRSGFKMPTSIIDLWDVDPVDFS